MLADDDNVTFLYSGCKKNIEELRKTPKLLEFLKQMKTLGRRDDASSEDCETHINSLNAKGEWAAEKSCDDPHIFAMIYEKPTRFVFTTDACLATCRNYMRATIDQRYCNFILIKTRTNYNKHRPDIHR